MFLQPTNLSNARRTMHNSPNVQTFLGTLVAAAGVAGFIDQGWSQCESWELVGQGMDGEAFALTVFNDKIVAGGYFEHADGQFVNAVARLQGTSWHELGAGLDGMVY